MAVRALASAGDRQRCLSPALANRWHRAPRIRPGRRSGENLSGSGDAEQVGRACVGDTPR
jgi:hypothetical protein